MINRYWDIIRPGQRLISQEMVVLITLWKHFSLDQIEIYMLWTIWQQNQMSMTSGYKDNNVLITKFVIKTLLSLMVAILYYAN